MLVKYIHIKSYSFQLSNERYNDELYWLLFTKSELYKNEDTYIIQYNLDENEVDFYKIILYNE